MIWLVCVIAVLLFGIMSVLASGVKQLEQLASATREAVKVAQANMIVSARMSEVICRKATEPAAPPAAATTVARNPVTIVRTLPDAPGEH